MLSPFATTVPKASTPWLGSSRDTIAICGNGSYSLKFKAKFGGRLVDHGRFRKVFAPWKLRLAEHAYRWGRGMLAPK
jgi:hypothetical protein